VRVYFEAYGCTQNYGEARLMSEAVRRQGHAIAAREDDADAYVLVTCTVIDHTERRMVKRIRALSSRGKPLVVAGCMAAAQRALVREIAPKANLLPPRQWEQIAELFAADTACAERAREVEAGSAAPVDAILPIAQGCLGSCTYCITRVARGRVRSYAAEDLLERARGYLSAGSREIKLTGQDTAAYGRDSGTGLPELLRQVCALPGEFRVRVGMADPLTVLPVLDDLVDAYADEKVYKFLHLPVQSGDDDILAAMRREYTVAEFEGIAAAFRARYPDLALSTDVIVGFPGETEAQFERSLDLVRRVRPDVVNITRFSARPGTPAAALKPVVGWRVKERSRRLTGLKAAVARHERQRLVGRRVRVLLTEAGRGDSTLGRTQEYRQVVLPGQRVLGEFLDVEIVGARDTDLAAVPLSVAAAKG